MNAVSCALVCSGDDVNVTALLCPTETGAPHWLFGPAGAGEKGNAPPSPARRPDVVVVGLALIAPRLPPLLSVDALSSLPSTRTTPSPVFTHLVCPPSLHTSPWHQDRRMLERRLAELEEELKVRRHSYGGHGHFACFCSISLALACAGQLRSSVQLFDTMQPLSSGGVKICFCCMRWIHLIDFHMNGCFCLPT